MTNSTRVCIFVDGENLRHSIGNLFPNFYRNDYLPKADWTKFFDLITSKVEEAKIGGSDVKRIRTYWYVVKIIDFFPFNLANLRQNRKLFIDVCSNNDDAVKILSEAKDKEAKDILLEKIANKLQNTQDEMVRRFDGWTRIHDLITRENMAIEFRKAGSIRYDLFTRQFGSEKAVDVKLAVDLVKLSDIYDIAIIVSGDQDYVPAVDVIKDLGKHTINVSFQKETGGLLPGGARRLNQSTDYNIEMEYSELKDCLNVK
ncbi:MAG: NYN domain-containing protein [Parcubacteria group bacterium]|nr:NYN domain-containing protein [Parcubacteria group bacterium]